MRLHHLEVTAFGPFAETVTVDFDHLSDAGLFLLSGPTGAGKTSVLDAVCFALYGDVPGARNTAKRLRADQAAPGVRPRVTLEATLSGRRFQLARSCSSRRTICLSRAESRASAPGPNVPPVPIGIARSSTAARSAGVVTTVNESDTVALQLGFGVSGRGVRQQGVGDAPGGSCLPASGRGCRRDRQDG